MDYLFMAFHFINLLSSIDNCITFEKNVQMRVAILAVIFFGCVSCSEDRKLPILGRRDAVKKIVDGKEVVDTVYQTVPQFSFLNQDSVVLTNDFVKGKIYTADFFFTTCPSICPKVKKNMLKLQEAYKGDDRISFLSHSLDPDYDTPSILKKYAKDLGVETEQWQFLTGDRDKIFELSVQAYYVAAVLDAQAPGGINHSGKIILIDTKGRMRGYYEGTKEEQVDQLIKDVEVLLDEEFN